MNPYQTAAAQTVRDPAPKPGDKAVMPPRILIVDDERVLSKNMKTYLSRGASDVRTTANAAEALEMLESFSPDALVLDYGLPDIDGLQTYAEIIRRQARKIDCVMVTGNPTEQLSRDAKALGIRHIICKPFRFAELQRLLEAPTATAAGDAPEADESNRQVGT